LEWATASPTQEYNFAHLPVVTERDEFWAMKQRGQDESMPPYHDIRVPKNTPHAIIIATFAFLAGFGFIWHVWWLVIAAIFGLVVTVLIHTLSEDDGERIIPAAKVEAIEKEFMRRRKGLA
jgi:cytochrome o ubiquinol oxidase subunit 1